MFCYLDHYFVILFRLLHFLFQRDLVSVPLVSEYDLITSLPHYTDYIISVYAVYMLMYTYTYMYIYIYVYVYVCGNTAYRAIEPLKITAREIPSPRQP